jgi:hypothetical protein
LDALSPLPRPPSDDLHEAMPAIAAALDHDPQPVAVVGGPSPLITWLALGNPDALPRAHEPPLERTARAVAVVVRAHPLGARP